MRATKNNVRRAIARLEEAARSDEMKGGGDPSDIPEIEFELKYARRELYELIDKLLEDK